MAKKVKVTHGTTDKDLLGPCGLYCNYCLVYRQGKCEGCIRMSRQKARTGEVFCGIYACSREKGIEACCDCREFPCDRYGPGKDSIFSESFVKWIRETCRR